MMSQHFLLSTAARTLSLAKVMRMSDAEAFDTFKTIRWASNGGEPFCPKCKECRHQRQELQLVTCKGCFTAVKPSQLRGDGKSCLYCD